MLQRVVVMVFLVIGSVSDIRYKRIPIWLVACFGVLAAVLKVVDLLQQSGMELLSGVATGVFLIIVSVVTGGQIGIGDGLVFIVLGMYIGSDNVVLLIIALILCAVTAGVLFVAKRVKRRDRLPFVPFVLCAYVLQQLLPIAE